MTEFVMPKSFDEKGLQFAWDSTSIKLASECMRKYYYKMIVGWQPETTSVHLRFGAAYATALEHYHKHVALGMDRTEAICEVVHEALIATWDHITCEDCGGEGETLEAYDAGGRHGERTVACETCNGNGKYGGQAWDGGHNLKTRGNLIRTIVWYLEQFEDDAVKTIILSDGKPAVEYSFKLPVDNDIIFCGHLDRLGEYSHDPYVQDQKTTGTTISARYFEGYSPDIQMSMYTFAGKAIFGVPVKGVIIDAAQIAVGFSRFERGFTFRTDDQLNEWYDQTMAKIEEARSMTAEQFFPMNATACGNYGGCEFRDICSRSPQVREQFLKGKFVKGPRWDPIVSR